MAKKLTGKEYTAAITRFRRSLHDGNRQYNEREDGGRQGALTQLEGDEDFISSCITEDPRLTAPLVALFVALRDLNQGVTPRMLQATPLAGGRRPDASERRSTKLNAAISLQWLLDIGFSLEEGAKLVADVLGKCGVSFDGAQSETENWKTIQTWRFELNRAATGTDEQVEKAKLAAYRDIRGDQPRLTALMKRRIEQEGEEIRPDLRDKILLSLADLIMRLGDANRPVDAVEALSERIRSKLQHQLLLAEHSEPEVVPSQGIRSPPDLD